MPGLSGPQGTLGKSFLSPAVSASQHFTKVCCPCCSPPWRERRGQGWEMERFGRSSALDGASLIAQLVENPPAMQETLARFLGQEDLMEKG